MNRILGLWADCPERPTLRHRIAALAGVLALLLLCSMAGGPR